MIELDDQRSKRIGFHVLCQQNNRAKRILKKEGIPGEEVFSLSSRQLAACGYAEKEIKDITSDGGRAAANEWEKAHDHGIDIIFSEDADFPPLLAEALDAPDFIYFQGRREWLKQEMLAVVGSRQASAYGYASLNAILPPVCRSGLVIVSGMAHGIDSAAHRLALREKTGTLGINAGGLLHPYPPGNRSLIGQLRQEGGIISEFPLDVVPRPFLFPVRNRLIAGIAKAVLVVEAAMKSGSLITARLALEQNRDVFAVPGNIDTPLSQGTNYLIQQGAKLIRQAGDILAEYGREAPIADTASVPLTASEREILDLMGANELKGIDYLVEHLNRSTGEVISLLMGLVLKNLIQEEGGGYRRIHEG